MRRRPPRSTLTYPLLPYTTLFRFIAHRAAGVDLEPLSVEPVADLVPDHRTDRAIVDGIVHPFAEEGRLQYAGREHDLVFEPAVIGVHLLRVHRPFLAIDRLAQILQRIGIFERRAALDIAVEIGGIELQRRIVRSEEHTSELQSLMRTSFAG